MNFLKNGIVFDAGFSSVKTENDAVAPNGFREATKFLSQDGENILLYSEDFTQSIWSKGSSTINAYPSELSPNNTSNSVFLLSSTSSNGTMYQEFAGLANTTYTFSVWVKAATSPATLTINLYNNGGSNSIGHTTFTTTNTWQRVSVTATYPSSVSQTRVYIGANAAFGTPESLYVYGAQLERKLSPTNYRKTTTVAVGAASTFITQYDPIIFAENEIYCRSIFVKPVGSSPEPKLLPFLIGGANVEHRLGVFNLITKSLTWQYNQPGEVGTIFKANYKLYDNGWIRVWWNIKKTSTNVLDFNNWWLDGYGGGSGGSMWVWGAQVEKVTTLDSEPSDFEPVGVSILSSQNHLENSINLPVNNVTIRYENNAIAPNGIKEASKFENTPNQDSIITPKVSTSLAITNSKFYCRSIFVKSAGANSTIIPFLFSASDNSLNRWIIFDINNKTIGSEHPSDRDCYVKYKEYDNGWIRFWVTVEKTAERTISQNWYIGGYGASSNKHEFWAWGAQFEEVDTLYNEPSDYKAVVSSSNSIFYNRDSNIKVTNPITQLTYQPSYGSRVTFSSNLNKYETSDGYYNSIPLSINSLRAKFDLKYDLNEEESKKLVNFIENKNGVYDITFSDPSSVYKNIDGFCAEYAINCINKNHYEVALSLEVNESPNLFNWYSMNFVNFDFKNWNFNTYYNKYDILYQNNLNNLNNLFKNSENFKKTSWWLDSIVCNFHKDILNPFNKYEAYSIQATPTIGPSLIGGHSLWPIKYFNNEYVWSDLLEKVPNLAKKMTFSIFIKPNSKFRFQLGIEYAAKKTSDTEINPRTSANYVRFNLNNLTLSSGGGKATGSIIQYPNGWYRCVVAADVENQYFIPILSLLSDDGSTHVYQPVGNTDGSLYIWGAQVQEELTDYIKTDLFPITPNKLNNFYYCSVDHNSKQGIDSQPQDSLSYWRRDFFFEPDIGIQNSVNLKISKLNLKNSFSQNIKTQKNIAALNLTYKFTNITTQKAKAILHFLENKGGYRRFRVNMDSVYNKPKVFYAPSWTHTWKYEDSHDIEVELIEDPMGVIPKN